MSSKKAPALKVVSQKSEIQSPLGVSEKTALCKELDCSDRAQVGGRCRLHYIKNLAQSKSASAQQDDEGHAGIRKWNRRRGNRATGFESGMEEEHSQAREAQIDHLSSLEGELTTILDSDEISPFKKTG